MLFVLVGFALIALFDLAPLVKRGSKKGVTAFLFIFGLALIMAVLNNVKISIPSVVEMLSDFFVKIGIGYAE
ncbi:MAG: hypothetical protein ACOYIQ_06130 [Christensenellales bacterium]|jgi:hypothetical protein